MFRVGVAGVLAEARFDKSVEISLNKIDVTRTAREIYEYITGQKAVGEKGEFLVQVFFVDDTNQRYLSNLDDFHFVLGEIAKPTFSFKRMIHFEGVESSLRDAVRWAADCFRVETTWGQVCDATRVLIDKQSAYRLTVFYPENAMINRQYLLTDLQALLKRLEADLLERSESDEVPDVGQDAAWGVRAGQRCCADGAELRGLAE